MSLLRTDENRKREFLRKMDRYVLKIYVTGNTSRSTMATRRLREICEEYLAGRFDLTVINILEYPDLAEDARILATPTVVKEHPLPIRRLLGDLNDTDQILESLDIPREVARKDGV